MTVRALGVPHLLVTLLHPRGMACVPAKDLLSLGQWHLLPVLVGTGDRSEGLQLSCLPRGCPAHPAGASVIDGLCLTWALDAASKVTEQEWREKAKKDLEEWNLRQNEQMEKNRANNRYCQGQHGQEDFLPSWDV